MHRFALFVLVSIVACKDDSGDESGGDTAGDSTADASSSAESMTGFVDACEVMNDCATCWRCARDTVCNEEYVACASSIECAGSMACIDGMCPPEDVPQSCLDHCCQNCMEHNTCFLVDAAVSCIEAQCADYCGGSTAVCG